MARYLYYCGHCQKQYEMEKPMSRAADREKCPDCGEWSIRNFTAPGISIKGKLIKSEPSCSSWENDASHACENCSHEGCNLE